LQRGSCWTFCVALFERGSRELRVFLFCKARTGNWEMGDMN
jgi:hypothetical protein